MAKRRKKISNTINRSKNERMEVNQQELLLNQMSQYFRQRMGDMMSGSYDNADTLHNVYLDFGYPEQLEFANYWNMYRRFGIAKAIVETYPDLGWMEEPTIEDTSDRFTRQFEELAERIHLWSRLKGLDIRQRVGRYAGLFIRVRDGLPPAEPATGPLMGINAIFDVIPLYEGQLHVIATDTNVQSETYDQPTLYQYRTGEGTGARSDQNNSTFNIHPSRIIIAAEGADNGSIYGISELETPYNSLMDLRKIIGAGGEGFYRDASQSLVYNTHPDSRQSADPELIKNFNKEVDDFLRKRMRRSMLIPGMDAKTLQSGMGNPKSPFDNALYDVAASAKIPATLLLRHQTGLNANNNDMEYLLTRVQSRRERFQTGMVRDFIDWLIRHGVLPQEQYTVEWSDITAKSDEEKLDNAEKMANINEKEFRSGNNVPFELNEIREQAGYDPLDETNDNTNELNEDSILVEDIDAT